MLIIFYFLKDLIPKLTNDLLTDKNFLKEF